MESALGDPVELKPQRKTEHSSVGRIHENLLFRKSIRIQRMEAQCELRRGNARNENRRLLVATTQAAKKGRCFCSMHRAKHVAHHRRASMPNPSLKRSANGRPPGPRDAFSYHAPRGPGVLPLAPA
jgi:hypothetical protein